MLSKARLRAKREQSRIIRRVMTNPESAARMAASLREAREHGPFSAAITTRWQRQ